MVWNPDRDLLKKALIALKNNNKYIAEAEYDLNKQLLYKRNETLISEIEIYLVKVGGLNP